MEYCKECKTKPRFSKIFRRFFCKCKSIDKPYQPERSKREDCEKGIHSHKGFINENPDQWKCDYCDAIIRRCGALNTMET